MKSKFTFGFFLAFFLFVSALKAQTVLYNFESGSTQLGTYSMAWSGAPYISSYASGVNPDLTGINSTATSLNLVENAGVNWYDNLSVFTLTTPTTITSANRYLHIMYRTSNIAGGGYSINLNLGDMNGVPGNTRFDGNLTANNTWQDIVVDLNYLITNNVQLSSFGMNPDLNGWGGGSGGTYNFDEIILSNNPLPRPYLSGNNLYDFEPGTAANITGSIENGTDANNTLTYPFSNPFLNAKNTSANVGKRVAASSGANWYTGFFLKFSKPVQVDATHKYLHVMVTVPVAGQNIIGEVMQNNDNVNGDNVRTITAANTWQDVVFDLSSIAYFTGVRINLGCWCSATAAGDYYCDNIYIDDNPNPRTNTISISGGNTSSSSLGNCTDCDITVTNNVELTIDQTQTIKSITVAPGAKLTLNTGNTLTATNGITLQSSPSGTATLVDNTMSSPQSVTGTAQQYVTAGRNWYVSIPLGTAASSVLNRGTSVVCYDEPSANWIAPASGTLTAGRGYISVASSSPSVTGSTGTMNFTGTLNTGDVSVALTRHTGVAKEGFNLVGNPYPCYLDFSKVDTTSANILSTIWFRTKTSLDAYTFDTYNGMANLGTTNGATTVTKFIPPMQAFWVRVKAGQTGGTLTFTNAMRAHIDNSGNRLKAPAANQSTQQVLRLQVTNGTNTDETVIYSNPNASNGYDAYDSPKMSNNDPTVPEIYTTIGNENLVINGMNNISTDQEIPLVLKPGSSSQLSIKASELKNFDTGTRVLLRDYLYPNNVVEQDITDGTAYSFVPVSTVTISSRFAIVFKSPTVATGISGNNTDLNIHVFRNGNGQITVSCPTELTVKAMMSVYNAVGQKLETQQLLSTVTVLSNLVESGVYFVTVVANGKTITRKVVIN